MSDPTLNLGCPKCARAAVAGHSTCPACGRDLSRFREAPDADVAVGKWHVVGSSLDSDIQVDAAAGKRARVRRLGGGRLELEDLGGGVVVDGKAVKRAVVSAKAAIQVAGVLLTPDLLPDDVLEPEDLPVHGTPITLGRDASNDFVVKDRSVSSRHAQLSRDGDKVLLVDLKSSNGTFVDDLPIQKATLGWRQPFNLANVTLTPLEVFKRVRETRKKASTAYVSSVDLDVRRAAQVTVLAENTVVGRASNADLVIDSPQVSQRHALLQRQEDGFLVTDLGSTNGTYVGGKRISRPTLVPFGQVLQFGNYALQLTARGEVATRPSANVRGVRVDVTDASRRVGKHTVVDRVAFTVLPGEMVAVMGPSGAGKTSLLTLLSGDARPSHGAVLFNGLDLYEHPDVFRHAVGYVPQEDVMHRALTAAEVLFFTGRLTFPDDTGDDEIRTRVDKVLRRLDLQHIAKSAVGDEVTRGISGGERKRLNVAMELMQEPSLLLLDEPTSGLDGRSAMQLVKQCRGLSRTGRTVVMTIHQPRQETLQLFDKVLLLTTGGKLAYFGPPSRIRPYFEARTEQSARQAANPADYALDVLDPDDRAAQRSAASWEKAYRSSELFAQHVQQPTQADADPRAESARPPRAGGWRQALTLGWRYALVKLRDRGALGLQLLQSPVIAFLTALLFHRGRFVPVRGEDDITPALFVLLASAVWFGTSNVAREIVGEKAIFQRETRRALRAGPYLGSMVAVQSVVMLVQLLVLVLVVHLAVGFQGSLLLLFLVVYACGISAMMLGLLLSALVRTQLAAVVMVPLVILPQVLLSGQLAPVGGAQGSVATQVVAAPMLLRWGYSAATQVEYARVPEQDADSPRAWRSEKGREWVLPRLGFSEDPRGLPASMVVLVGAACSLGALWLLRRRGQRLVTGKPARRQAVPATDDGPTEMMSAPPPEDPADNSTVG